MKGGAIFIEGNTTQIHNCTFIDNNATHNLSLGILTGQDFLELPDADKIGGEWDAYGGAIYIYGDRGFLKNNTFRYNSAIHQLDDLMEGKGGAIYIYGDYNTIIDSYFDDNFAHSGNGSADVNDVDQGLGGAIYTRGNYNDIAYCDFKYNTARNGSAIYSRGVNLTIEDDYFMENQAWSYLLINIANPEFSYYSPTNKVIVNITHIGGDNIINALYNDGVPENIIFYNVTYEHSTVPGDVLNTGYTKIHPVDGVENSNDGTLLYQDSREDLQKINVRITKVGESNGLLSATRYDVGDTLVDGTFLTGHWGNVTFEFVGLGPGVYSVSSQHPEDWLYTQINNETLFEIVPKVDLEVKKDSDKDEYEVGDTITYNITVTNNGDDATDVVLHEIIPNVFTLISYEITKGEFDLETNDWFIGSLNSGENVTLILKVNATKPGVYTNTVNVTSYQEDINLTNNAANKTVIVKGYVDLELIKNVNVQKVNIGDNVVWMISVKNKGNAKATNVKVMDKLPNALEYIAYSSSIGKYDSNTGVWSIGDLNPNDIVYLNITTKVLQIGRIFNDAGVSCDENETDYTNNNDTAYIFSVKNNDGDNNVSHKDGSKNITEKNSIKYLSGPLSSNATGNPIFIVFLVLLTLITVSFRKK